jgi:hypothetical protein
MGLYRRSFCIWGYTAGHFVYGAIPQVILYMGLYRKSFCLKTRRVGDSVVNPPLPLARSGVFESVRPFFCIKYRYASLNDGDML